MEGEPGAGGSDTLRSLQGSMGAPHALTLVSEADLEQAASGLAAGPSHTPGAPCQPEHTSVGKAGLWWHSQGRTRPLHCPLVMWAQMPAASRTQLEPPRRGLKFPPGSWRMRSLLATWPVPVGPDRNRATRGRGLAWQVLDPGLSPALNEKRDDQCPRRSPAVGSRSAFQGHCKEGSPTGTVTSACVFLGPEALSSVTWAQEDGVHPPTSPHSANFLCEPETPQRAPLNQDGHSRCPQGPPSCPLGTQVHPSGQQPGSLCPPPAPARLGHLWVSHPPQALVLRFHFSPG